MGLLDQVGGALGGALGQGGGGVKAILLQQLVAMLSKPGALQQMMGAFKGAGLENILQSWVGTGQNLPISGDQVKQVLGSDKVAELAQHTGVGESETSNLLASILPQVIDKVTPGGSVPTQGELGNLAGSLGKLFS
jgi:uncharacterized protein YidB (DUF937 family)